MKILDVLPQLRNLKKTNSGYSAKCPAHDDDKNSLSVSESADGKLLLYCQTGNCSFEQIISNLNSSVKTSKAKPKIVAEYNYRDENNQLLYQAVRFEPKDFRQRKPSDNGEWDWKLNGTRRVLYHLRALIEADKSRFVFLVEGEKDVQTLEVAGFIATCNVGGAGKWRDDYNEFFKSRHVVILPDNDDPGREHAHKIAKSLKETAASIRIIELPNLPLKGDVSDWLQGIGSAEELRELVKKTAVWNSNSTPNKDNQKTIVVDQLDDATNARNFALEYHHLIRWQRDAGRWFFWDGTVWSPDKKGFVEQAVKQFASRLYDTASSDTAFKHATRSNNRNGLTAIFELAKTEPSIPLTSEDLDRDKFLFNCKNGIVDLRTGELKPHDPAQLITKSSPFDYDKNAQCPKFLEFLESIQPDPHYRHYLQKAIGYSMTGQTTERAFFICHGFGRNGKSVFVDLWSQLFGNYARNTTAESLMKKQTQGIPNDIARLQGARFVTTLETGDGDRLNESLIKGLTGGDKITARYLFAEYFDFYFEGKLWLATNHKPQIRDQSSGMWERVKLISFSVTIEKDKVIDKTVLLDALFNEAPGILAWAVKGCLEWQQTRLLTPVGIQKEIDDYKFEQDSIAQFLHEATATGKGAEFVVENGDLYNRYKFFCENNGEFRLSHKRLTQSLLERGFDNSARTKSKRFWTGLRLID